MTVHEMYTEINSVCVSGVRGAGVTQVRVCVRARVHACERAVRACHSVTLKTKKQNTKHKNLNQDHHSSIVMNKSYCLINHSVIVC